MKKIWKKINIKPVCNKYIALYPLQNFSQFEEIQIM